MEKDAYHNDKWIYASVSRDTPFVDVFLFLLSVSVRDLMHVMDTIIICMMSVAHSYRAKRGRTR